ncbi:MAG: zinc metallopeptidase [Sphingobacteriales bacterium]|nr:zinc metallopeptidase [Sphingobacteriales bacterium]
MIIYIILPMLLSLYVSWRFKSKVKEYSQVGLANQLSGAEIAEKMLRDSGITDVQILSTEGELTDHYHPEKKTVNLSHDVYYGRSVIAAAVAAHECGHAVQHAKAYAWLTFRSKVVPIVSITSRYVQWVLLGGIFLINTFPQLLLIGIILFAATTLFTIITLPVEFDASKRALAWLDSNGIVRKDEYPMTKDALKWAASTYVVAAIASIATLLYYAQIYMGRRD